MTNNAFLSKKNNKGVNMKYHENSITNVHGALESELSATR